MYKNNKVVVVMPAYNAAQTLEKTHAEVNSFGIVDKIIVVDDFSRDTTTTIARSLPNTRVYTHAKNLGYGGNQKTCYRLALEEEADIVIMVHPDYQYTPKLIPAMVSLIVDGQYHCVLGSRVLGGGARKGGMPWWRYISNRFLTFAENLLTGAELSEYHTGYRAYTGVLLKKIPFVKNSDDFVFDNEILAQIIWENFPIAELSCPTRYAEEASSISFSRSVTYGLGCLRTGLRFRLARWGLAAPPC